VVNNREQGWDDMPRKAFRSFGSTELEVMQIVWVRGCSTVKVVHGKMPRPVAHATVKTTLERLAEKDVLRQEGTRKAGYTYTPKLTREEYLCMTVLQVCGELGINAANRQRVLQEISTAP
jgi:predicted transcriptional regulator